MEGAAAPSAGAGLLARGGTGLVYGTCLAVAVLGLAMVVLLLRGREGAAG